MIETLTIDNLEFEVRRSQRRKTLGLTVDRFGELVVHAPSATEADDLMRWIEKKLLWVHQKLLLKDDVNARATLLEAVSGENISYLGHNYRLKLVKNQKYPLIFDGHWFYLRSADRKDASRYFQQWYEYTGSEWLMQRLPAWQRKTGVTPAGVVVTTLGYHWGSCGKNHVLRFNWQLFQLPVRLIDYVIVHELVHLKERNHTPEYWYTLGAVLPDWQARKIELSSISVNVKWKTDTKNIRVNTVC